MHIKLKRAPGIYIAGFMGSGKSTVGRILADRLGWDFVDLDREIEATEQTTISDIFETRGEPEFRQIEQRMIGAWVSKVERGSPTVLALGGGAFVHPGNYDLIENHGISIWLDCSFDAVQQRLGAHMNDRPLARDPEGFRRLYHERRAGYSRADFRVDGDCEPLLAVEAILHLPVWK
jgi:shikimate kinase